VLVVITIMVLITVLVAGLVLVPGMHRMLPRLRRRADSPHAFGYNTAWLAVRTENTSALADVLGLEQVRAANWRSGIATTYDDRFSDSLLFVSPPVDGWSFVVGIALPTPVGRRFVDKAMPLLLDLAKIYPEVQYFVTCPPIGLTAWARLAGGRLMRAYAAGEDGVLWNKGKASKDEPAVATRARAGRARTGEDVGAEDPAHVPGEDDVLRLAGLWSLDPTKLEQVGRKLGPGLIGEAPLRWRPERLKGAAALRRSARAEATR